MPQKPEYAIDLGENLTLCWYKRGGAKGVCLYDKTRGMNLAMGAETERDAFVEALEYYQERLLSVEKEYTTLKDRVDKFVALFTEEED